MEYLPNHFTLEIPSGCFPLSTDSMILSHFVRLPRNARVIDLGSGCGTLGLLLCAADPLCHVTGIEKDLTAHNAACSNIRSNALCERMESICADVREISSPDNAGVFDVCVSNPPYFAAGPAARSLCHARREDHCTASDIMHAASHMLKYGGDFFLVHRPERLAELIAQASAYRLEAKQLLLIRHRPESNLSIIALHFRKGAKPGLSIKEAVLFNNDGLPTPFYHDVYHL